MAEESIKYAVIVAVVLMVNPAFASYDTARGDSDLVFKTEQANILKQSGYLDGLIEKDTDGDGLPDKLEKLIGTDPNKIDTDGDGLSDYGEFCKYKTNPLIEDSDGDGTDDDQVTLVYFLSDKEYNVAKVTMQVGNPYMYLETKGKVQKLEIDPGRGTVPIIQNGRTFIPARAFIEALGFVNPQVLQPSVEYNKELYGFRVSFTLNDRNLSYLIDTKQQINRNSYFKGITPKDTDLFPIIVNDRILIPFRLLAEIMNCYVEWDGDTKTITSYLVRLNYQIDDDHIFLDSPFDVTKKLEDYTDYDTIETPFTESFP